jgi:hypothetical protein
MLVPPPPFGGGSMKLFFWVLRRRRAGPNTTQPGPHYAAIIGFGLLEAQDSYVNCRRISPTFH